MMEKSINIKRYKKLKRYFSTNRLLLHEKYFLLAATILLLFLSWNGFLAFLELSISFLNILYIHKLSLVWMVNTIIIALPMIFLFFQNYLDKTTKESKKEIKELKTQIKKNIELAKALANNNWKEVESKNDVLTETLLSLGKHIRTSKKKEEENNWIINGKEHISNVLRNSQNLRDLSFSTLKAIVNYMGAIQGSFYIYRNNINWYVV